MNVLLIIRTRSLVNAQRACLIDCLKYIQHQRCLLFFTIDHHGGRRLPEKPVGHTSGFPQEGAFSAKQRRGISVNPFTQGIVFLDIFPILRDPVAFETLITHFVYHLTSHTIPNAPTKKIDVVVGPDARGFILGPIIASRLGAAFVPVRKQGKLPGKCISAVYQKEYGAVSSILCDRIHHQAYSCEHNVRMCSRCRPTRSSLGRRL